MERYTINQLISRSKEIIAMCNDIVLNKESPNVFVIQVIRREFETIEQTLIREGKVLVLNLKRDLWSTRTILDSANYENDTSLFEKVFEFEKMCKKLSKKQLKFQYLYWVLR